MIIRARLLTVALLQNKTVRTISILAVTLIAMKDFRCSAPYWQP